ncbi:MAG: hypothetical protein ACTSPD_07630 [Promethearchaeota archaeon]
MIFNRIKFANGENAGKTNLQEIAKIIKLKKKYLLRWFDIEKIKDKDIFNRLFEPDEKLLWSGKPYAQMPAMSKKYFYIPIALILLLLIYYYFSQVFPYIPYEGIFLFILLLISAFFKISSIFVFQKWKIKRLRAIKYYITNKRIFSIRKRKMSNNTQFQIVNLLLLKIEYYFFERDKEYKIPVFHFNFKATFDNIEDLKDTVLIGLTQNDGTTQENGNLIIKRDDAWSSEALPEPIEVIYRLNNILTKDELISLFDNNLYLNKSNPPVYWKESFFLSEFYEPY